ncbi:Origin of replication complex subunit 5 [Citrus sinensis]|uniref:Origin of replication complex subunit 5 n=1 Tax=Citrus sinensis TaxID=2711 RepID=A0ACB8MQZ1_CITSI|nr:Origin of replication complex subunit 5 [Citrus sinensis]KAH9787819.1 Origin of replication complex subunit 5 [Citrus sinensis]
MAREKEESMQVSRRATRSSTFSANNNGIELGKPNDSYIPTLGDLVFGQEPISLDDLLSRFPGRRVQILELLRLLGTLNSSMPPLFVYGSASTGKTSIIIQALINVIDSLKENAEKTSTSKLKGQVNGKMIYLIFDNFELVREWDKSSSILPFLFGLSDILKMPEVGMIFISSTSPDTYHSNTGYVAPIHVYFPECTEDDLRQIFMRNQANQKLYSSFLDIVLRPFCRITKRVDELSTAFSLLFKRYCEPLSDLGVLPNGEMKRRLFSHLQPHIAPSLNEIFRVASQPCLECGVNQETRRKGGARKSVGSGDLDDIGFHMSTSAKYLLVSAFLASRNPATLDASLFDTTGVSDSRKRKRKASEKSLEQKEAAEQELLMKGPGTFSLERLLAIFQCITSVGEEEEGNDGLRVDEGSNALMSDILLQLTSLCNSNFIVKGGSCPLEGSTRYRSTLSEDLAIKVARSIKFPLSKYLYRR